MWNTPGPSYLCSSIPTLEQHLHAFIIAHSQDISTSIQHFFYAWSELANWGEGKGDVNRAVRSAIDHARDLALWMERLGVYVGGFRENEEMGGEGEDGGNDEEESGSEEEEESDSDEEGSDSHEEGNDNEEEVSGDEE